MQHHSVPGVRASMTERTFLTFIEHGGAAMYPLLLLSVVSVAVVLERLWALTRASQASRRLHQLALEAASDGDARNALAIAKLDRSPLGRVYEAIFAPGTDEVRERVARRRLG